MTLNIKIRPPVEVQILTPFTAAMFKDSLKYRFEWTVDT